MMEIGQALEILAKVARMYGLTTDEAHAALQRAAETRRRQSGSTIIARPTSSRGAPGSRGIDILTDLLAKSGGEMMLSDIKRAWAATGLNPNSLTARVSDGVRTSVVVREAVFHAGRQVDSLVRLTKSH